MNKDNKKNIMLKEEILEFIVERYFNNESIQQIVTELEEFKKTNGNSEDGVEILKDRKRKIGITNLKLERISRGLTQGELALLANVGICSIVSLERGGLKNASVGTLIKLSKALDTTVTKLFFSQEEI